MINLPIFRAEIVEGKRDADYKKGFTVESNGNKYAIGNYTKGLIEVEIHGQTRFFPIKKDTLSIHFPDMLDSQGNKIFASLSEDGKGGDIILEPYLESKRESFLTYKNYIKNIGLQWHTKLYSKIIGIKE